MKSSNLNILAQFSKTNLCVIGDLILDTFIWGKVRRISPEAPVPVVEVERESRVPGGAANVAGNIASLKGRVLIAGVVGLDEEGDMLLKQMKEIGVDSRLVWKRSEGPTSSKTRVVAHHQQVVRIDREVERPTGADEIQQLFKKLEKVKGRIQAILLEDYGKGVITQELVDALVSFSKKNNILLSIDPKKGHFINFHGVDFATPNYEEAAYFAGIEVNGDDDTQLDVIGETLLNRWGCRALLITLGQRGMKLFGRSTEAILIPTFAREVFDVSGAGDTVIAVFMMAVVCGSTLENAARLANIAAGIVVGKLGTAVVTTQEIEKELKNVR